MAELTYDWVAGKPKTVPMDQLPPKVYEKDGLRINRPHGPAAP